jgi:hypothetical protein
MVVKSGESRAEELVFWLTIKEEVEKLVRQSSQQASLQQSMACS